LIIINQEGEKPRQLSEFVPGPLGVSVRNSYNALIEEKLGWEP